MYQRLSFIEREEISRQIANKSSVHFIAKNLGRSPSTIYREIKRSRVVKREYYRAYFGEQRANVIRRKKRRIRKLDQNESLKAFVIKHILKKWSPEQIAKRLKFMYPDNMDMQVSHESIYSYIYVLPKGMLRKKLTEALRKRHVQRRKKGVQSPGKRGAIQNYISIEERPAKVADRTVPGHWEGDMIVGKQNKSAIGTLVERTTRMTFLVKLSALDANTVRKAYEKEFQSLPKGLRQSLTYDQGVEMSEHKLFSKNTDITVYFAHPKSPWERGTNENTNGLLRQYFPKGTDFSKMTKSKIKQVQDEFNDRPRKALRWSTPHEKFIELLH